MKFALLFHYDPSTASPSEGEMPAWLSFDKAVREAGVFVHDAGFHMRDEARTISVRDGVATTTDGPGIDATDMLAGFYVVDVADIDAALAWAKQIPTAAYGKVEVRPIVDFEGFEG